MQTGRSAAFAVSSPLSPLMCPLFSDTLKACRGACGDDLPLCPKVGRVAHAVFQGAPFTCCSLHTKGKDTNANTLQKLPRSQNAGTPEICLERAPLCVDLPVATLPYLWSSFYFSASLRVDFLFPLTGCAGGGLLGFWSRLVNGAGV